MGGRFHVHTRTRDDDDWRLRASGALCDDAEAVLAPDARSCEEAAGEALDRGAWLRALDADGLALGDRLRAVRSLERSPGAVRAKLLCSRRSEDEWHAYRAHPALLESALQLIGSAEGAPRALRCIGVDRVRVAAALGSEATVQATLSASSCAERVVADVDFLDGEGRCIARLEGLRAAPLVPAHRRPAETVPGVLRGAWADYEGDLEPQVRRWILVSDQPDEAQALATELQKEGHDALLCDRREDLEGCVARFQLRPSERWGLLLLHWGATPPGSDDEPAAHRRFRIGSWADAIRTGARGATQTWIATRGVFGADGSPAAAAVVGDEMARFASLDEIAECRFFDASPAPLPDERVALARLIGQATPDRLFAARGRALRVPRLRPWQAKADASDTIRAGDRAFRAVLRDGEGADCAALVERPPAEALEPHEIEVEVHTAALDAHDGHRALDPALRREGEAEGIGCEFAGVVRRCGADVRNLRAGDAVMGVADGSVARRLVVPETRVVRVPANVSLASAAAFPLAYLRARVALDELARLRETDRVLIVGGDRDAGRVAMQLARQRGARVTALAANVDPRELFGTPGTPADHVQPLGVCLRADDRFDLILSTVSGDSLHAYAAQLAPGGRIIDVATPDPFAPGVPCAPAAGASDGVAAVDPRAVLEARPELMHRLLGDAGRALAEASVEPPHVTRFPVREAGRVLRYLVQDRAVDRVAIDFDEAADAPIQPCDPRSSGALLVVGRRAKLRRRLARALGASAVEADCADAALEQLRASDTPVDGIVHVSAVDDAIAAADAAQIAAADLGFVAWVCVRGDGPDAARAWETRGLVDRARLATRGGGVALCVPHDFDGPSVADTLARARRAGTDEPALYLLAADELSAPGPGPASPWLAGLADTKGPDGPAAVRREDLLALAGGERRRALEQSLREAIAAVLGLGERERSALDLDRRLGDLGLDSLMTLELFVGLSRDLELTLESTAFPADPTLSKVVEVLLAALDGEAGRR